jgi:GNAT superfamily N-acetyltransferase
MIRLAEERDFEGITNLLRQLNPDDPVIKDGRDKAVFNGILHNPDLRIFVLIKDDKIISTCYLNIIPNLTRNASPYAVIENVVTDSAYRNQGNGKAVVKFALDYAWQAGCYKVMLQTGSKRESTHHFYRSSGFVEGERFAFIARPAKRPY